MSRIHVYIILWQTTHSLLSRSWQHSDSWWPGAEILFISRASVLPVCDEYFHHSDTEVNTFKTMGHEQNGWHFANSILKCVYHYHIWPVLGAFPWNFFFVTGNSGNNGNKLPNPKYQLLVTLVTMVTKLNLPKRIILPMVLVYIELHVTSDHGNKTEGSGNCT